MEFIKAKDLPKRKTPQYENTFTHQTLKLLIENPGKWLRVGKFDPKELTKVRARFYNSMNTKYGRGHLQTRIGVDDYLYARKVV